jgi:hypothetical protein
MIQEFEALKDDFETLETSIEENEEVMEQILELVLALQAKVSAIEELLLVNSIIDEGSLKAIEETNLQETIHKLNS